MPKITALHEMPDGRIGVTLDVPAGDPGAVTIYTDAELEAVIARAVLAEREACATIADERAGDDTDGPATVGACAGIALKIRSRSNQ